MTTPPGAPENTAKPSLKKTLLPIAGVILFALGGFFFVKTFVTPHPGPSEITGQAGNDELGVGTVLPDFPVQTFGGNKTTPISKAGGKVTMINFWATWCEACVVEMPSIVQLRKAYKDKGFEVVAISLDEKGTAIPKALQKMGIDFPVYVDPEAKVADIFNVQAIPLTVIIDQNRKILHIENGERDWNASEVRAQLEKWLAG